MVAVALTAAAARRALRLRPGRRIPFLAVDHASAASPRPRSWASATPMTLVLRALRGRDVLLQGGARLLRRAPRQRLRRVDARARLRRSASGLGYGGTIISLYSVAPIAERFGKRGGLPATARSSSSSRLPCSRLWCRTGGAGALWRRGLAAETFTRVARHGAKLRLHPGPRPVSSAPTSSTPTPSTRSMLFMALYVTKVGGFIEPRGDAPARPLDGLRDRRRLRRRAADRSSRREARALRGARPLGRGPRARAAPRGRARSGSSGRSPGPRSARSGPPIASSMFRLSPPEALGEFYGIYGMVGRFSAITGPLVWGRRRLRARGHGRVRLSRRDRDAVRRCSSRGRGCCGASPRCDADLRPPYRLIGRPRWRTPPCAHAAAPHRRLLRDHHLGRLDDRRHGVAGREREALGRSSP